MGLLLGQDLERILDEVSRGERAAVAKKLADQYSTETLSESDRELAHSLFKILSEDLAVKVRASLAESLKDNKDIPHELALKLANDVADVSVPVLEFSELLTDQELSHIIETRATEEQTAIAKRKNVSSAIADALVVHGDQVVVTALVHNKGADIEEETFHKVIDNYSDVEEINSGMVFRNSLPINIAERLVATVADELRMYLVSTHDVRDSILEEAVLQGRENTVANLLERSNKPVRDVAALITQMEETGRLTSSIILKALEIMDLDFFEYGIAIKAKIPVQNARILLKDQGSTGFLALYKQAYLPMEEFDWCQGRVETLYGAGGGKTVYVGMTQNTFDETGGDGINDDSWMDIT
ncbi:MAG: DUF2336 domain-containing protein [Alphaproteobacteria bacterium]|nr:DUF2336 domain-containing protein [Rhodospirillales bacterium]MCW9044863.1 DUF2336 domain-containing protein [Alphaproteobacteria bacterium]